MVATKALQEPILSSNVNLDPLLWNVELPLRRTFYPMGFPSEIVTNSLAVLDGAEEGWGQFQKRFDHPPLRYDLTVVEGGSPDCPPLPVCRARQNLMTHVADSENFAIMNLKQGIACGWLTQAVAENLAYLRYAFLESVIPTLLEVQYLTSVHAACVEWNGCGVLLCGDSGAGKSTLAYACARNGWRFLADDASKLLRDSEERVVVGNPHQIRFRESAVELFPELKRQCVTRRSTGKMAIELATATLPDIHRIYESRIDYIVFLNRDGTGGPTLSGIPKNEAQQWFEQINYWGDSDLREAHRLSLRKLLSAEVFELRYSGFASAVERLESLVDTGS